MSTVLVIEASMILYGEDRITPAKKSGTVLLNSSPHVIQKRYLDILVRNDA
jgi:hypothetical protein